MKAIKPKAVISWSTGKDSAWAYYLAKQSGDYDIVGAITTLTKKYARVSMHGVREELLDIQMARLKLPCHKVYIPAPCPNDTYQAKMRKMTDTLKDNGVTHVIFGDLFLEDVRDYRLAQMKKAGMECVFPLWGMDTAVLAQDMINNGLRSRITTVDPRVLDKKFAGREFGPGFHNELPDNIDPCGENGEFHSVVTAGPMFDKPIVVSSGEVIERDGFIFADIIPI